MIFPYFSVNVDCFDLFICGRIDIFLIFDNNFGTKFCKYSVFSFILAHILENPYKININRLKKGYFSFKTPSFLSHCLIQD